MLSIARPLARPGCTVTTSERGGAGPGATGAAAGMLAFHAEAGPGEEQRSPLSRAGRDLWTDFAQELGAAFRVLMDRRDEETSREGA